MIVKDSKYYYNKADRCADKRNNSLSIALRTYMFAIIPVIIFATFLESLKPLSKILAGIGILLFFVVIFMSIRTFFYWIMNKMYVSKARKVYLIEDLARCRQLYGAENVSIRDGHIYIDATRNNENGEGINNSKANMHYK